MIKNFLSDALKYLPAQVTPAIAGFISIPIITRIFLPHDYGNFSLVMATVMVLTTVVDWLPISVIRFYPAYERHKNLNVFYGNTIKLSFISIIFLSFLFLILAFWMKSHLDFQLSGLMFIGIGVFILLAVFNFFQYFLRAKRQVKWYSGFAVWKSIMAYGIGFGLIFLFKMGIESLLWGIMLSVVVILPLLWRKAAENKYWLKEKLNISLIKEMTKYSLPLVLGNLAAWILSLSDRYVLEFYRGTEEVGIYSASYNISEKSIMLLTSLFMLAAGPISIHIWEKEGKEKSADFLNKITRFYLIICIPAVIGFSILSRPIVYIMAGQQYFGGYKIIPFVTSGMLLLGLQHRFQAGFIYYKKTGYVTFSIVLSGLLNLFLNIIFIPKYGYFAAAVTTLVSYSFLLLLMILLSRRFFIWKFPFRSLMNVIFASSIMGIIVYYFGHRLETSLMVKLFSGIALGISVYFFILMLIKELSTKRIQLFYFLKR